MQGPLGRPLAHATVVLHQISMGGSGHPIDSTRTDALGTYKLPGFGAETDPKDIELSCDKEGYKPLRVVRRSSPSNDPGIPIEIECTLAPL